MGTFRGSNLRRRVGGKVVSTYLPLTGVLAEVQNYYRFEEAAGTRVDSVGGLDLSVINNDQPRVAGKQNFAWAPDTSNGWLENAAFTPGGWEGISISVWVANPAAVAVGARWICSEDTTGNTAFRFYINAPEQWAILDVRNAIAVSRTAITSSGINWINGNWRHLVGTWGSGDGFVRIYVDGVQAGISSSEMPSNGVRNNGVQGLLVGTLNSIKGGTNQFGYTGNQAYMDELAIFDGNVGPSGVAELWNAGVGRFR